MLQRLKFFSHGVPWHAEASGRLNLMDRLVASLADERPQHFLDNFRAGDLIDESVCARLANQLTFEKFFLFFVNDKASFDKVKVGLQKQGSTVSTIAEELLVAFFTKNLQELNECLKKQEAFMCLVVGISDGADPHDPDADMGRKLNVGDLVAVKECMRKLDPKIRASLIIQAFGGDDCYEYLLYLMGLQNCGPVVPPLISETILLAATESLDKLRGLYGFLYKTHQMPIWRAIRNGSQEQHSTDTVEPDVGSHDQASSFSSEAPPPRMQKI